MGSRYVLIEYCFFEQATLTIGACIQHVNAWFRINSACSHPVVKC